MRVVPVYLFLFFFNDTATTEIYTLSLHDALPIWGAHAQRRMDPRRPRRPHDRRRDLGGVRDADAMGQARCRDLLLAEGRSEEHTSELQSRQYLVCRLLLEKKKKNQFLPIAINL